MSGKRSKQKRAVREVRVAADRLGPGRFDLRRFEAAPDTAEEIPDLPDGLWDDARIEAPVIKEPISIRLDADVLAWFRAQGPRYQSRINAVLRSYMHHAERSRG